MGYRGAITMLDHSQNYLWTTGNNELWAWKTSDMKNWQNDRPAFKIGPLHNGNILNLLISKNDEYLFTFDNDDSLKVWRVSNFFCGKHKHAISPVWETIKSLSARNSSYDTEDIYEQNPRLVLIVPAVIDHVRQLLYVITRNLYLKIFDISDPTDLQ
jgi:hypothetical protein